MNPYKRRRRENPLAANPLNARWRTAMTAMVEAITLKGFPFESDEYEREFYNGTVLDGWHGGDTNEKFTVLNEAIERAIERSTNADVWGVYQIGKSYNDDGYRDSDRIVALVFKQHVYLFNPEPKEPIRQLEADIFEQVTNAPLVKPEGKCDRVNNWDV
jgi:hypothetical protein